MARNRYVNEICRRLPKVDLLLAFKDVHGRFPNLINPKLMNDKILWRMFFDRRPDLAWTCDKLEMKNQARLRCAEVLVAEVLWSGENLQELTNVQLTGDWVLKHISGTGRVHFGHGMVGPSELETIRKVTSSWASGNKYSKKRSWALSMGKLGYLVERRLSNESLNDYKFHVFSGQVAFCGIDVDRFTEHKRYIVDADGSLLPTSFGYAAPDDKPELPSNFADMVRIANELGKAFDYIRIDLYNVDGKIYLGEFTPYPARAQERISDFEFEEMWGALWTLPSWRTVLTNRYKRPSGQTKA